MFKRSNNKVTNYDEFGEEYMITQNKYYSKRLDNSRKALYSQIDTPIKNKRLLDVGCGFGKDLSYFQKKGAIVYGIDISKKMIELAKRNNPNLTNISIQSFEKTNFEDCFFDIIVSRFTLHYATNLESVFKELHRILKSKGILIFLVSHPILTFLNKKNKNYHKREIIQTQLYDNKFTLKQPTHTFSEYFNEFVLKNFKILSFYEDTDNVPEFFISKLEKI
ncbi:MAG: class I SAM-dependent methyltransferase [Candidatus Woesearchaeota archaeon]|nr:class I SAM-dependent methyltransferase [Candidatus Woesearchaeota archaeon]